MAGVIYVWCCWSSWFGLVSLFWSRWFVFVGSVRLVWFGFVTVRLVWLVWCGCWFGLLGCIFVSLIWRVSL